MGCVSSGPSNSASNMDLARLPFHIDNPHTSFFNEYYFDTKHPSGVLLGEGGFSKVLRGRSLEGAKGGEGVAVKCVDMRKLQAQERIDLLREVGLLRKMNHPNIIRLFSMFEDKANHMYFIVTELVEGGELFDRIVHKEFYKEVDARNTAEVVLDALNYLHERNIVHRDLKPENLLLKSEASDHECKLADFGFAIECQGEDQTAQLGTPGYVAPEILKSERYGTPVDMWSCGVIIFVILGGYPPFPQPEMIDGRINHDETLDKIKKGEFEFDPTWWKEVSDDAKDLIKKLLCLDTKKRLTAKQALRHPWFLKDPGELTKHNLEKNLQEMKRWNAKRKFRSAVHSVIAANRLQSILKSLTAAAEEEGSSEKPRSKSKKKS
mmetsp:Transcript_7946/g.9944  ORF Transcript_7946/g.9944 Transcript_7946/m.9944 type:complete len:379 (-) Transcript_7946:661-1797(-)